MGVSQDVLKKEYGRKTDGGGVYLFSGILTLVSSIFFLVVSGFKLDITAEMLIYALLLSTAYFFGVIFSHLSLLAGPLSITVLISSFAMIIPMGAGIIFYNEPLTLTLALGFAFLAISLTLINTQKSEERLSLKWLVYVTLALVGNGMFSVILSLSQRKLEEGSDNRIMAISMFISAIIILGISVLKERREIKTAFRHGWHRAVATGCLNGGTHLCSLLLMRILNISLFAPISSGGAVVLSSLVGVFVYKEKLSARQYVGIVFGTLAVILMSL